ncbi:GDSL-type esterase/lipase family protein [Flavobacterium chungnamense]|uniref:SGNH/GDSL hydrolase family protein n=1 Tax=Flavobacterium chungnamense TaxID=706182 RepID=A0ABP7UZS1_9FLAO
MKKLFLVLLLIVSTLGNAQQRPFWNEINAFVKQDSINKPKDKVILFVGSSSFRLWKDIKTDLNNDNILNRAFGGATLLDMIYYKDKNLLNYNPSKIVIYCGENDVASSEKVDGNEVFKRFKKLYKIIRKQYPTVPLVFVSIKPCILRWSMKDRMIDANERISRFLSHKKQTIFVNIWDAMLENGEPKKDIFIQDNLHMNAKGYAIWIEKLKGVVNE